MKVEEFLRQYKFASKARESEEKFLQERMVRDYVPYVQKIAVCNSLVETCWYEKDEQTGSKRLHFKSPNLYLFFVMRLVRIYTDIQFEDIKVAEAYDCLNKVKTDDETTLVQVIINRIPAVELAEFRSLLDMVESDTEKNEYEVGAWLSNKLDNFAKIFGSSVLPTLSAAGISIDDIKTIITNLNK